MVITRPQKRKVKLGWRLQGVILFWFVDGEVIGQCCLAWRIPGTGEPGGLPSMGSHRVRHDWSDLAAAACICVYIIFFFKADNSILCTLYVSFSLNTFWRLYHLRIMGHSILFFFESATSFACRKIFCFTCPPTAVGQKLCGCHHSLPPEHSGDSTSECSSSSCLVLNT